MHFSLDGMLFHGSTDDYFNFVGFDGFGYIIVCPALNCLYGRLDGAVSGKDYNIYVAIQFFLPFPIVHYKECHIEQMKIYG